MKFRYAGDEVRTYGDLSLDAEPGTVYDLEVSDPPDFRWELVAARPSKPKESE